jgi:hypothetical protein
MSRSDTPPAGDDEDEDGGGRVEQASGPSRVAPASARDLLSRESGGDERGQVPSHSTTGGEEGTSIDYAPNRSRSRRRRHVPAFFPLRDAPAGSRMSSNPAHDITEALLHHIPPSPTSNSSNTSFTRLICEISVNDHRDGNKSLPFIFEE